jgi:hypothetical protein
LFSHRVEIIISIGSGIFTGIITGLFINININLKEADAWSRSLPTLLGRIINFNELYINNSINGVVLKQEVDQIYDQFKKR